MISPIEITIKGFPRSESEDFDKRSLSPVAIHINDYPTFFYFNKDNPMNFNVHWNVSSLPTLILRVKPNNPAISKVFSLTATAFADFVIKGNFNEVLYGMDNKLKATSNYFIRDGFAKSSRALVPDVLLKVLIPGGNVSATSGSSFSVDCYQIKANLLSDWDNVTLSEMDNLTNENIAGTIIE